MKLSGKKVLVTGAGGFIGSHLVEALVKEGASVTALVHYNSFNRWGWLENTDCLDKITVISGDVRDSAFVRRACRKTDVIFNLAALIAIPYSYTAPESYIDTNIKGALNVCQGALENECLRVIQTSTSEVYGTARHVPIDENHPLQPQSPYSASKIGADSIAKSFFHSFQLPVIIARPFNTYGPRQSARAIIPTLITQMAAGQKEIKVGNLSPTRDFNFVADTVQGFIQLAQCGEAVGKVVNIGSNREISINDLIQMLKKLTKSDAVIRQEKNRLRPDESEVQRLLCDNTLIKSLTGYEPAYSLEKGLLETIGWIEKNLAKYKVNLYNV